MQDRTWNTGPSFFVLLRDGSKKRDANDEVGWDVLKDTVF